MGHSAAHGQAAAWRGTPSRRTLWLGLTAFVLCLAACTTPALADSPLSWAAPVAIDAPNSLDSLSCPSTSLCVAGDDAGNVVTSTTPAGGPGAWTATQVVVNAYDQTAMSCPSTALCVAHSTSGSILTSTNPTGGSAAWNSTSNVEGRSGISCPSISLCVGIDNGDVVTSSDPTGGTSSSWHTANGVDNTQSLQGLSCPSTSLCVAVDSGGDVLTTTDPGDATPTWTTVSVDSGVALDGVSCPSIGLCVAVDDHGNVVTSTNPTGGAAAWTVAHVDGSNGFLAVSCTATPLCVATDLAGNVVTTTDPTGGAGAWTVTNVDQSVSPRIDAVSCPSDTLCVAADQNGNVIIGTSSTPQPTLTVTLAGSGSGTVAGDRSPKIACPGACAHQYSAGTAVTLTETPTRASTFAGWAGGGCSGLATTCHVTLSADTNVTATFKHVGTQAALRDATPHVHIGQNLVLSAAGTVISAGQRARSYKFVVGGQTTNCPGQFPVLNAVVTRATKTTASVTVTTTTGLRSTATAPVTIGTAKLPKIKIRAADVASASRGSARSVGSSALLGPIGALAYRCTPAGGVGPSAKHSMHLSAVKAAQQAPLTVDPQLPPCASDLKVGIIDGLGCFKQVTDANPLPSAETKLLCNHEKRDRFVLARLAYDFCLAHPSLPPAFDTPTPGGCNAFTYDSIWESSQPVSIDGLEVDPVNGARLVLARSGSSGCTAFSTPDSAYLISADAVVKVGGLPITLHVPDFTGAYNQAAGAANCAQNSAGALANGDLSGADCLGSISIPSISLDGKLIPQINGPIDLSVGPTDLGIELGEFEIPNGVLPLPILPALPLSGAIKVNLTGIDAASVAVHLQLPLLDDGMGHSLTGDTTLSINNTNGLQLDSLDISVPSLAQLGLARLRDLEFHFKRPSYFAVGGTIDLSDVIDGLIHIHVIFDQGNFREGDVNYFGGAGGGAPLFGPLFLTQLSAKLTLHPTHIHGDTQISVGPSVTENGCGSLGIHGTADLVFGDPWTLDATGEASILCADLGPSKVFHADSDGNFSYGEHLSFTIPDLGDVNFNEVGSAKATIHDPLSGVQPGDFLAFQGDLSGSGDFKVNLCHDFGGFIGNQCAPGSPIEVKPSLTGTIALGYENSKLVGGAGLCASLSSSVAGQSFSFDVGAGIDDLPNAILALATNDLPGLASQLRILTDSCDVSRWQLIKPPAGTARDRAGTTQAPTYDFAVARGEKVAMVGLQGAGGAPAVVITEPNGRKIDVLRDGINVDHGVLEVRQASTGQTLIEIPHALAGHWRLQPVNTSPPIKKVESAHSLPTPVITAGVTGHGLHRTLRYRFTPQPGLGVAFFEGVEHGRVPVGVARAARGTIRFTPALGGSGRRQLLALLTRNGLPARIVVIGSYKPGTVRPGRASGIRITHTRQGWRIAWRPGSYATSQQLTIRFIDGAEVLFVATARGHAVTLPRSLDAGARPTAVAIVALRGQVRGQPAAVIARLKPRRR